MAGRAKGNVQLCNVVCVFFSFFASLPSCSVAVFNRLHGVFVLGPVLRRLVAAKHLADDVNEPVLLLFGEPVLHVFDYGAQLGAGGWTQVQDLEELSLGELAGEFGIANLFKQSLGRVLVVGVCLFLVCKRAGLFS